MEAGGDCGYVIDNAGDVYFLGMEPSPGGEPFGLIRRLSSTCESNDSGIGFEVVRVDDQADPGVTAVHQRLPNFPPPWYERVVNEQPFEFEWDEVKAHANQRKHSITFELASTIFFDPNLLTVADLEHGATEDRWFSIGFAGNGALLSVVYLWSDSDLAAIKVRLISARRATQSECGQYQESL